MMMGVEPLTVATFCFGKALAQLKIVSVRLNALLVQDLLLCSTLSIYSRVIVY